MSRYFDLSALAPAELEFPLLADTHDMERIERGGGEFPSRTLQGERVAAVLDWADSLPGDFLLHLGDIVQTYPDNKDYESAFGRAWEDLNGLSKTVHLSPGNHDVGDKSDPTMPTHPVDVDVLERLHAKCGRSWRVIRSEGVRIIILNSQLFGSGLAQEKEQREWLEVELSKRESALTLLFLHLPLYLGREDEAALGNYDVVDEVSRSWLLGLIKGHGIDFVGGAHVHFPFFDRIGSCEYHQFASSSFTRPGFSYMFASSPPPEQGRDDRPKLGIYLMRIRDGAIQPYFIRTYGATKPEALIPMGSRMIVAPRSSRGRGSALGVTLTLPIATRAVVPIAFPSVRRQEVTCDLPFFLLQELGVQHLRLPVGDVGDSLQLRRIQTLKEKGLRLIGFELATGFDELKERLELFDLSPFDGIEWQLAGRENLTEEEATQFQALAGAHGADAILCPVIPGEEVEGKQHLRTRVGLALLRSTALKSESTSIGDGVDEVVVATPLCQRLWERLLRLEVQLKAGEREHPLKVALSLELHTGGERRGTECLLQALAFCASRDSFRLFVSPLVDLDRTMDVGHGLCDTCYNPQDRFVALRTLNGVLYPEKNHEERWKTHYETSESGEFLTLENGDLLYTLVTLSSSDQRFSDVLELACFDGRTFAGAVDLRRGLSWSLSNCTVEQIDAALDTSYPFLVRWQHVIIEKKVSRLGDRN